MTADPSTGTWFLPDVPWTAGDLVVPLVHGATYFRRLHDELQQLQAGDRVYFTDWRGDPDERLLPDGPTVGDVPCGVFSWRPPAALVTDLSDLLDRGAP